MVGALGYETDFAGSLPSEIIFHDAYSYFTNIKTQASVMWLGKKKISRLFVVAYWETLYLRAWIQWRAFVEIIGGDESLQHQLKRQDCVNFWGAKPPRPPTAVLFCALPRF